MNMDLLEAKLMDFHPAIYKSEIGTMELKGVRFLTRETVTCENNMVYIVTEPNINWDNLPQGLHNIIYCGKLKQTLKRNHQIHCIHIAETTNTDQIFERVQSIFEDEERYKNCTELLLRSNLSLFRDALDIEEIADIIFELLDNPFFICNTEGVLICCRSGFNPGKNLGDIGKVLSGERQIGESSYFREKNKIVENNSKPVMFDEVLGEPVNNVVSKIMIDHATVAYLLLLEHNRKIQETDFVLLQLICDWLSLELQDNTTFWVPKRSCIVRFLADLMQDHIRNPKKIQSEAKRLKIGVKKYHYVLVADYKDMDLKVKLPHTLAEELENILTESQSMIFDENIVLYINTEEKQYFSAERNLALEKICDKYQIKMGISYRYRELTETANAYMQAKTAVYLGGILRKKFQVYEYAEFSLYHWMQYIDTEDVTLFCHPKLIELLEYDKEHHTEYVYTVYIFILCNGKQVLAAKELNIHRSTMIYRMDKIAQLTNGLDLYDTYTVTRLYLSYGILLLNGILDPNQYNKI